MERIWNKSELEQMLYWLKDGETYLLKNSRIIKRMIGQTVQWCKDNGYHVTHEMIAKTEIELVKEAVSQANDKLTERLDKGEIGVTLENGTVLKVGEKVRLEGWKKDCFAEILFIGELRIFVKYQNGDEYSLEINKTLLPYTEPKEEPKPLETWTKTMDLRWENEIGDEYALQQKQISNLGNEKWCDVETVIL